MFGIDRLKRLSFVNCKGSTWNCQASETLQITSDASLNGQMEMLGWIAVG